MIRSYTVSTTEVDDCAEAVREITGQFASIALLGNTIGIAAAHPEFVSSGIYEEVAKALPFPVIGATSISHCVPGAAGTYMLSFLILTSDDCRFSCGVSGAAPEERGVAELARECYKEARGRLPEEPKLAILYVPFLDRPHVDEFIAAISEINGKLPVFGAIANDDRSDGSLGSAHTLYCGGVYRDRYALALVSGPIDPKFYIASVTEEVIMMPDVGVVTAANRNKLLEVNNVNATKFFKEVGFLNKDPNIRDKGMLSSIFVLRLSSGEVLSRIPVHVEDDGISCGGQIVTDAVISVAFNTKESVLETASRLMKTVKEKHGGGTAIIHTCLGRRYGLLNEPMRELEVVREILGSDFNYAAMYVNGELCPIAVNESGARNLDHNQTLAVCVF